MPLWCCFRGGGGGGVGGRGSAESRAAAAAAQDDRQIKQYWEYIKGTHNIDGVRNVNKVKGFVLKPPPTGGKWRVPHRRYTARL